ncbi:putative HTH-type transcriptional regulator [Candidatus Bilamarchaeum dharawalense]|uniref:Putative HTH-type transcriptional regulator n=1 Tax=Candidatus Bilamarchaeum dharawalense TaxID=2885759 RepID=A0A5E4LR92_9ARCH|nr:putative HTH-type transcriptional regulator [Candidatus Bilamarchaeum dharawalense]
MFQLDEKDEAILDVLRENSSLSIGKIARKTGIPIATVHHRIKKLRAEGIIKKYTIIIDQVKLGKKMIAHVLIKAMPKIDHIALLEKLMKHDQVEDGSAITGEFDLIIKVRVTDIDGLDYFVLKFLRTFDEISQTESMIAFRNIVKE